MTSDNQSIKKKRYTPQLRQTLEISRLQKFFKSLCLHFDIGKSGPMCLINANSNEFDESIATLMFIIYIILIATETEICSST